MPRPRPTFYHRTLAFLLASLVFGLTLAAVSPALHDRLHGHGCGATDCAHGNEPSLDRPHPFAVASAQPPRDGAHDPSAAGNDSEHRCAVTLFAEGTAPPAVPLSHVAPVERRLASLRACTRSPVFGYTRHRHPLATAPPLG